MMKYFFNISEHIKMTTLIYIIVLICIAFYFLKNIKTIDYQLKLILILLFFGFIYIIYYGIEEDKNVILLKNNYSLTTGNIEEYFVPKLRGRGSNTSIKYIYHVNNKYIKNSYQENPHIDIPNNKPDLSTLYLVIYEKTNPKNSFILLNYPIKNSDDLEKYNKLFADKIPKDAFKVNAQE